MKRTIALIKRDGVDAVVKAVNNKDPRFIDRDLYVFIHDLTVPGKLIGHATNIKLTRENNINYQDENGKYFVREIVELAKTLGSGWVDYRLAIPNGIQIADQSAYVERVGDYAVGARVYKADTPNENTVGIIAGNPNSAPTYLQFAYDMAVVLNDGSNLRVVPVVGMGGEQNIRDVRSLRGIDVGFTQSNILNSYLRANKTFATSADDSKIVYIANLFSEEVHLAARSDIRSISQLRGKKVNIDINGSGTAFTMQDVFRNLGIDVVAVNLDQADAMEQMRTGEISATVLVAGKPVSSLAAIRPEDGFRLLPIPYASALQEDYLPNNFTSSNYPGLVEDGQSVETIAVSAVLIAYDWHKESDRYRRVKKFVEALFAKIDEFQKPSRHPKWRSVNLASTLSGWDRFDVADELLAAGPRNTPVLKQTSFEKFLQTRNRPWNMTVEERERLFSDFMAWSAEQ